ncbi:PKD domain-containing protein [Fulvivirga sediminis]|uniref:PKD domain-containing protein n=1 Tax=Fulvivirga sediminis TaxID=2803949 RepID=A0A937F519_9BACT|nr:PKD domain-containing protein [Fulvivirga sediminis]MBL3655141.1 PKD domain-containing protein [Fulvivirga sediminis]
MENDYYGEGTRSVPFTYLRCVYVFIILFFISTFTTYGQHTWNTVAIGGGGFVSGIIAAPNDPNVFYARTDVGGAYRWDEASASWVSLLDWVSSDERGLLGVDGIAIDPNEPGRVYMLAGTSYWNNGKSMFLRSDDYGNTWDKIDVTDQFKAHGNGMGRANGERVMVDPNNSNIIFCGTRYNGLWKSTNRGSSWSRVSSLPVTTTPNGSGVSIITFDATSEAEGVSQTIYAGVSRPDDNLYVSHDAGSTWELVEGRPVQVDIMPQRMAISSNGETLYVTYGNGGGPHPMLWDGVTDYYNRGAVYKFNVATGVWTDVSPQDFMQDLDKIAEGEDQVHYGAYSGISIDPNDEDRILATSINSYRGPQYWEVDGTYEDSWGDNIFLSEDGGETWREMFRYYWQEGGIFPDYDMMDDGGIPWIRGNNIHWSGAIVIDPFNSERAFVTAGNGVWATENLSDSYVTLEWRGSSQDTLVHGKAIWQFMSKGIEETVPSDVVTIPGGPTVSVILDYDGFVHEDLDEYSPYGRHKTNVSGSLYPLGSTTGIDYAVEGEVLVKTARAREVSTRYNTIPIGPVQWSEDGGLTWTTQTYITSPPDSLGGGKVAISTDGEVTLWMPEQGDTMYRYENAAWTVVDGVSFEGIRPEADKVNVNKFYTFDPADGGFYVSTDKGVSFTKTATLSAGYFETVRAVPGYEGDVWVPLTENGLTRTTNSGASFTPISSVSYCEAVGLGKAAPGASYPTVFIFGTVGDVTGVFMSTNQGASWVRINDDEHEYGGLANGEFVQGDWNVFGRVYMSTAGRGIVYGEPSDGQPVNTAPTALFNADPVLGMAPLVVNFDGSVSFDADGDSLTYAWDFGDSKKGSGAEVTHTYMASGTYTATLTVFDGQASDDYSLDIKVNSSDTVSNSIPVAAISASTTSGELPLAVTFDASSSTDADGDLLSYSWDFADGSQGTGVEVLHTFSEEGVYEVLLTVDDGNGGSDSDTLEITVTAPDAGGGDCEFGTPLSAALPSLNVTYDHVHVIGAGGPSLSNFASMGINWSLPSNAVWQFSISTNNGSPGWWNDLRTVSSISFGTASPAITFEDSGFSGLDGSYYVAIDGDNFVMVSQGGEFAIYFSNSATPPSCSASARMANVARSVEATSWVVYPNPLKGERLQVNYPLQDDSEEVTLSVMNSSGQVVFSKVYEAGNEEIIHAELELSGLNKGFYLLQVREGNRIETKSFVKP